MSNFSLKDQLFNKETVSHMANQLKSVHPQFLADAYIEEALEKFPDLELKDRLAYLCDLLYKYLPKDYYLATKIMLKSLKGESSEDAFTYGAYSDYVMKYGCTKEYVDDSLELLGNFTKIFSAEFAIRRFINDFPDKTFDKMLAWSKSPNHHQRRLASEGFRPTLPWAMGIRFDYKKASQPLHNLYYDDERYVTRSVSNHLNDISKIDPAFVLAILNQWKKEGKQDPAELDYMINHSLRTLIKKGHKETMEFLGYHMPPRIKLEELSILSPSINIGQSLIFKVVITGLEDENFIIDYKVTYPSPNKKKSTKVFKLKTSSIKKGMSLTIEKKHPFKLMTTKKLYSGTYKIDLQINGTPMASDSFTLTV